MNILNKVTLKTLQKNRTRTVVTIIGIILSVSLFTAVTTSVSSLQNYLREVVIATDGSWHGATYDLRSTEVKSLAENEEITDVVTLQNLGYAKLDGIKNEYKPYLFVGAVNHDFPSMLPVRILEGRMPEDSREILIPKHLKTNGGVELTLGNPLTLNLGERESMGEKFDQETGFLMMNSDGVAEELKFRETKTYTIVGFYERPSFEGHSAPGYTALTIADTTGPDSYDAYIQLYKMKDIYSFLETEFPGEKIAVNSDLLRFSGQSDMRSLNVVLYSLAAILMGIIMFGSGSLIYNAFSISVSERTKQFGLLKSIGATKRQILHSVLFEALTLSLVGIPLGLMLGIAGIGITLKAAQRLFLAAYESNVDVVLSLHLSFVSIFFATFLGLLTVLISAYIPAKKAIRLSAMDAIRQNQDIRISAKKVKTSHLAYRFFGFEGILASKNFKRNRKTYRATVISLFMSVVLFISATSFSAYAKKGMGLVSDGRGYDIRYTLTPDQKKTITQENLMNNLSAVGGVSASAYVYPHINNLMDLSAENLGNGYVSYANSSQNGSPIPINNDGTVEVNVDVYFIDDATYKAYIDEKNLESSTYLDMKNPRAIVYDYVKVFDQKKEKYITYNMLDNGDFFATLKKVKLEMEGNHYIGRDEVGAYQYMDSNNELAIYPAEEVVQRTEIQTGSIVDSLPFCIDVNSENSIILMYPYSALGSVLEIGDKEQAEGETAVEGIVDSLFFKAASHKEVYDKMYKVLDDSNLSTERLYDMSESVESNRALIAVMNIFSYGFIVLISLIAAANVFNTISTNINLRRREFATLKSVGLTQKGFGRMMSFECLLYGAKSLLYGIPVAIGVTYLIYLSVLNGWETTFYIPWYSIAISIGSVFVVVFASMIYAKDRLKNDNPIDALKNENL